MLCTLLLGQTLLLFVVCFKQLFAEFCSKMASGSRSKKASVYLKNLPHKLNCDRCNISVLCPKVIKTVPECESETIINVLSKDSCTQTTDSSFSNLITSDSLPALIAKMNLKTKSLLLSLILKSEAKTLWIDQENACLSPTNITLSAIASVDPDEWLKQRHPLLLALAFGLSTVSIKCVNNKLVLYPYLFLRKKLSNWIENNADKHKCVS